MAVDVGTAALPHEPDPLGRTGDDVPHPSTRVSAVTTRDQGAAGRRPAPEATAADAAAALTSRERGRSATMSSDVVPLGQVGRTGAAPELDAADHGTAAVPAARPVLVPVPEVEPVGPVAPSSALRADEAHERAVEGVRLRLPALLMGVDTLMTLPVLLLAGVPAWLALLGAVAFVVLAVGAGLSRSRFTLSVLDDLPALVGRALAVSGFVLLATAWLEPTAVVVPWLVLLLPLTVVLGRAVAYPGVRALRRRGMAGHRVLVLGAGVVGRDLAQAMLEHPELGLDPVGFVDASPLGGPAGLPVPVVGSPDDLADVIVAKGVSHVIIAFTAMRESEMVETLRTCDRLQAEISVVPRLFELAHASRDTDEIDGITIERLRRAPFRSPMWGLKRAFDMLASGAALLLLSPLLAVVAVLVRVVDGGPGVLFRQERVGIDGRTFELLKFRSLRPTDEGESDTRWNIKDDDRMSWLGRILRRSSIDELPQLFNILRGDMSLVGPRPERPHFVAAFDDAYPRYGARHRVPSGLTGWAQIHGLRGDTSIEERARFDNYYIENWSLWLDIKILLRTVGSLTKGSG